MDTTKKIALGLLIVAAVLTGFYVITLEPYLEYQCSPILNADGWVVAKCGVI